MAAREYALIVAGGSGTRIKSDVPKQFLSINGLPVLMHTINAFHSYKKSVQIIVVLPASDLKTWEELCEAHQYHVPFTIAEGGKTRFQSVRNGLKKIEKEGIVAIHDGVRPVINREIIAASFQIANLHGSAVAAVRLKDSIRVTDKDGTRMVDRSKYRIIQTPQTFRTHILKKAFELPETPEFTDDASVVEKAGFKISLFEGSYKNIKITTAEDLVIAEAFLMDSAT